MLRSASALVVLLLPLAVAAEPPGEIRFEAGNLFSTADGRFREWRIERAEVDPADLTRGEVVVVVDVASLDTGIEARDEHLRTADFFEVERWPTATVRVHHARPDGEDEAGRPRYRADFDLRIRDVERTLQGRFVLLEGDPPVVEGELEVDRLDFGVGEPRAWWNPASIDERVPVRFRSVLPTP